MNLISNVAQHLGRWFHRDLADEQAIELQALEERVLYSAAPIPLELLSESPDVDLDSIDQQLDFLEESVLQLQQEPVADEAMQFEDTLSLDALMNEASLTEPQELVFIDTGVENYEALLADVLANFPEDAVTVKLIDSQVDGVAEITRVLSESTSPWSAIHIVSHGESGAISLGNVSLGSDTISDYSEQIASWQDALTSDADILIYGCDLATDPEGEQLVDEIASLSGADVAASDDLTGQAGLIYGFTSAGGEAPLKLAK